MAWMSCRRQKRKIGERNKYIKKEKGISIQMRYLYGVYIHIEVRTTSEKYPSYTEETE